MTPISRLLSLSFCLIYCSILSLPALAENEALPVAHLAMFAPGKSWTWDYFEPSGRIYSTEKYTVIAAKNQSVLIEMSADYDGGQNLKPHHRILVDLSSCLRAYSNPHQKKPWMFAMYYLSTDKSGRQTWTEIEQRNTLAFEEKFNCNPHVYSQQSAPYLTVFETIQGEPAFSQRLWRRIEGSWFAMRGERTAVALFKKFSSDPSQPYIMKLRAQPGR